MKHNRILPIAILPILIGLASSSYADETHQSSTGAQSPVVKAVDRSNVTINYGIPQAVMNRLLKILDEKDVALQDKEEKLQEMVKRYNELEARLAERSEADDTAKLARQRLHEGDIDGAEKLFRQSLHEHLKSLASEQTRAAADAFELGSISLLNLEYQQARDYYEQAAQLAPDNSDYLNQYGLLLFSFAKYDKAIDFFEKALAIDLEDLGDRDLNVGILYNNLGLVSQNKGEYDKAIGFYEKALSIGLEAKGEGHPQIANIYNNLGTVWQFKGYTDKGFGYLEKALSIDLEIFGDRHPNVAMRYNNLGMAWRVKDEYDKAIGFYEKALSIFVEVLGDRHPSVALAYNNLGDVYKTKGEYGKAIDYITKALSIFVEVLGDRHPSVALAYNNLGAVLHAKGKGDEAIGYYEKALAIFIPVLGADDPLTITAVHNITVIKAEYWIQYLDILLVLVGFGLLAFASTAMVIVKRRGIASSIVKLMIGLVFALALIAILGGLWLARNDQAPDKEVLSNTQPVEKSSILPSEDIEKAGIPKGKDTNVEQHTEGAQSPAVISDSNVNIQFSDGK